MNCCALHAAPYLHFSTWSYQHCWCCYFNHTHDFNYPCIKDLIISFSRWICFWQFYQNCFNSAAACDLRYICYMIFDSQSVHNCNHNMRCFAVCMYLMYLCNVYCNKYSLLNCSSGATVATLQYLCAWSKTTSNNELHWCKGTNHKYFTEKYLYKSTRCSAIAEIPRCRVRYSFRQK